MLSFRKGRVRPFIGTRDYDNGSGTTLQTGLVTYTQLPDGDESYQTTYVEFGGRSDHLDDAISRLRNEDAPVRRVSMASDTDRMYVGSAQANQLTVETVDVEAATA